MANLFIGQPIPPAPVPAQAGQQVAPEALAAHAAWVKGSKEIAGLMLMTMEPDIQRNLENLSAYEMLHELKTLFAQQAEQELLQTVRDFHSCKQEEGQPVSSYVLKMKSYIDNMERLGHPVSLNLGVSLILISLRKEFDSFVQNYNMHDMGKTVNELHAMLKLHEQTLTKKDPALHVIRAGKRKCPQYLAELLKNKKLSQGASCLGLRGSRKLKPGALSLYVGNGQRAAVEAIGSFHLCLPSRLVIILNNCHYAPFITRGIISVSRLYDDGFVNRFVDNAISVSRNNLVYFSVVPRDGIFEIDLSDSNTNDSSIKKRIEKLQHDGLLNSTDLRAFEKCVSCIIVSRQGASYFVTFTDDFSRYGYVYLLEHKHEVFETFKVFQKKVEYQLEKTIKSLRSDRGGEYMSQDFLDYLKEHGIIAHRTPRYTPQHNGVSERRNRTLLDMVRSMMSQKTLPKSFWDYALETAARILNMVPTKKVEKTPYEVWHGQSPKLSYLKVWGCEALVKRDTLTKPDKLEPRSIKCIFVGYLKETMGYSFHYPPENKVLVARNAEFLENSLITQKASGSLNDLQIIQDEDTYPSINTSSHHEEDDLEIDKPQSDIIPIRRSTRTQHALDRMCLYIDVEEHELGDLGEPANYKAACKTVSSKWLFKKKTDMDGAVHTYKARLVAKGFTQTYGVDYEETFSPVADIRAIRILIAIATYYDYEI
ncbi:retrotransposon protein, putative, ty1-copia subclass [Tanacetum coccineum]|uniref:Retrotransposon protein, putative, ty1-copia subclass n=1 Tax=Tanacetum coccineum TaxID=301880 RepID=A0ABQ4YPN6_9ASTR